MIARENVVMQEIREARRRLMAKCHNDEKLFFKYLLNRQKVHSRQGKIKLVRFERAGGK